MDKFSSPKDQSSFIFNLEVLVEENNNAAALEKLLHALNSSGFVDFRILSGIRLGEEIELRTKQSISSTLIPIPASKVADAPKSAKPLGLTSSKEEKNKTKKIDKTDAHTAVAFEDLSYSDKIKSIMKNNTLIRLIVNKGLGIKLSIPCRIINMDETENIITIYHVDEKQVYTFRLNEIEDFSY
jgi:ribosomal protein S25